MIPMEIKKSVDFRSCLVIARKWSAFMCAAMLLTCSLIFVLVKETNLSMHGVVDEYTLPMLKIQSAVMQYFHKIGDRCIMLRDVMSKNPVRLDMINIMRNQSIRLRVLQNENDCLKKMINILKNHTEFEVRNTEVLSYSNALGRIIIPTIPDIRINNIVINSSGIIGKVLYIKEKITYIESAYSPNFRIAARSLTSNMDIILAYDKDHRYRIELMRDSKSELIDNEIIVTRRSFDYYQSGIHIGKVHKIGDTFYVESNSDLSSLRYISIIVNKASSLQ